MRRLTTAITLTLLLASAAPAEARCVDGRELAADMRGRISPDGKRWYACLDGRKPVRVSMRKPSLARVASPYAAATVSRTLVLIDLRQAVRRTTPLPQRPSDLVLGNQGSAVVLAGGRLQRVDADGTVTLLDEGAIAAGSLALSRSGRFVYWMKDGAARSAAFPASREELAGVQRGCAPPGKRQYAADVRVRLWEDREQDELLACMGAHGRRVPFDATGDEYYGFTVTAPFAALIAFGFNSHGDGSNQLGVVDLRDGGSDETSLSTAVSQFVLTDRGVVVLIQVEPRSDIDRQPTGPPTVQRVDRGKLTQLDAGAIADYSLALSPDGRRVYWTRDALVQTRPL